MNNKEVKILFDALRDNDNLNKKVIDIVNHYNGSLKEFKVHSMKELDKVLKDKTPYEIAELINNDFFNVRDDYFEFVNDSRIESYTREGYKEMLINDYWSINQEIINVLEELVTEGD